jgi:NAD(P)-dependent dehydrogenase (short-subunit alcohol dehydrogenase family)
MEIGNVVASVTGGSSGLGGATVRNFAAGGAKVAIFDMNAAKGSALAAELGPDVLFQDVDVTSEQSVKGGLAATIDRFGKVNVCVNCAGVGFAQKTMGKEGPHSLELFRKVIEVNLTGTFNTLRLVAEAMTGNDPAEDGQRGVIINTASVAAYDGQKGQAAYSASKGGIVGMTLPIARDLAFYGSRRRRTLP